MVLIFLFQKLIFHSANFLNLNSVDDVVKSIFNQSESKTEIKQQRENDTTSTEDPSSTIPPNPIPEMNPIHLPPPTTSTFSPVQVPTSESDQIVKQYENNIIFRLFSRMDYLAHFSLSIIACFFLGYFNFSFLWVVIILYIVNKMDLYRQKKILKVKEREWKKLHSVPHDVKITLFSISYFSNLKKKKA